MKNNSVDERFNGIEKAVESQINLKMQVKVTPKQVRQRARNVWRTIKKIFNI